MKKYSLLFVLIFTASITIFAQDKSIELTFEQAFEKTLTNNPQITATAYEEKAAEQERRAVAGMRLPKIGVTGAYLHLDDDIGINYNQVRDHLGGQFNDIAQYLGANGISIPQPILDATGAAFSSDWGGLSIIDQNIGFVGASATLPIYVGGKINVANRAANLNFNTTIEQGKQTRNALISELVERYYGASLAVYAVKVREQVVEAVRHHLEDAIAMERNGMIARSERLYMEVKMAEAERDLMSAKLQSETTLDALANTVNEDTNFAPISHMFVLSDIQPADYYKELAQNNSPLLKQVELKRNLALENVKLQRAELLPQVALFSGARIYNYHISKHMPKWVVGAGVSINIFDGWHKEHKLNAAKSTVNQVTAIEQKAHEDIGVLIDKLYNEMQNYYERIPSINKSLEFAKEYLRAKQIGFREGVSSSVDVIDAELNLARTRIEKLQAAYYYDLMLAKLLEAVGDSESFLMYSRSSNSIPMTFEE